MLKKISKKNLEDKVEEISLRQSKKRETERERKTEGSEREKDEKI